MAEDGDKVQDDDDDAELRKVMSDIFIDNTKLRKQVNFVIRRALKLERKSEKDDDHEDRSGKTVLDNYIERWKGVAIVNYINYQYDEHPRYLHCHTW